MHLPFTHWARRVHTRLRDSAALLLAVASFACGESGDPAYLVKDLRVLAVQANPPEVLYDAPGPASFSFSALVVDPQGGVVDYRWSFCPVESDQTCLDYEALRAQAPTTQWTALDEMRAIATTGSAVPVPDAQGLPPEEVATRAVWPHDVPSFDVSAPPALYEHFVWPGYFGSGLGAWPSAVLELTSASQTLRVGKRVVVNSADPSVYTGALGIAVCTDPDVPNDPPGCVPLRPRVANANPTFSAIGLSYDDSANAEFEPLVGTPDVPAGSSIRLLPILGTEAREHYQTLKLDLQTLQIFVEDKVEEPSVSWFSSAGELQEVLTWEKITRSLDTVYTAPREPPAATHDLVTLWMVARDGRGGVAWHSVELHITSP